MSYTYNQFVASIINRLALPSPISSAFATELPNIIDAAEQRCYREIDLLATRISDSSANVNAFSRNFTLPQTSGIFVVVERFEVITPAGATTLNGTRNTLVRVSPETLDFLWPGNAIAPSPSVPEFFAMVTDQIANVGPPPDANYVAVVAGTARPAPLSSSNQTTILTLYLPDLFFAAAMVIGAAYQKSFGASADDPRMAMSWEQEYQICAKSAIAEEFRKKSGGSAWSPIATPPEAQPARN